jgi:hypothetical protein
MDMQDLIDQFNNGKTDFVKNYFNDTETFFKVLYKRGLLDEVDTEDYQNELLLIYYEYEEEKFWEEVLNYLSDVELVNGKPYLIVSDRGELSELFCDNNRNSLSKDTVELILSGEYGDYGWNN